MEELGGVKFADWGLNLDLGNGSLTGFGGGGVGVLDTMAGDFTTGKKDDALGLSFGLADVIDWSLLVDAFEDSFRDITVEVERFDLGSGGVGGLFEGRVPTVRGAED